MKHGFWSNLNSVLSARTRKTKQTQGLEGLSKDYLKGLSSESSSEHLYAGSYSMNQSASISETYSEGYSERNQSNCSETNLSSSSDEPTFIKSSERSSMINSESGESIFSETDVSSSSNWCTFTGSSENSFSSRPSWETVSSSTGKSCLSENGQGFGYYERDAHCWSSRPSTSVSWEDDAEEDLWVTTDQVSCDRTISSPVNGLWYTNYSSDTSSFVSVSPSVKDRQIPNAQLLENTILAIRTLRYQRFKNQETLRTKYRQDEVTEIEPSDCQRETNLRVDGNPCSPRIPNYNLRQGSPPTSYNESTTFNAVNLPESLTDSPRSFHTARSFPSEFESRKLELERLKGIIRLLNQAKILRQITSEARKNYRAPDANEINWNDPVSILEGMSDVGEKILQLKFCENGLDTYADLTSKLYRLLQEQVKEIYYDQF